MSNIKAEICSGDFTDTTISPGSGESYKCAPVVNYPHEVGDFEHTQRDSKLVDVVFEPPTDGDSKPPQRIFNSTSPRTPEQISADLEEKLRLNTIRRQIHINTIVQKSRLQIEKVTKVRQKIASKMTENCVEIESVLFQRKTNAEKARQKFITDRVEKFRKQIEHAEKIKNKKIAVTKE